MLSQLADKIVGRKIPRKNLTNLRRARLVVAFGALSFFWCLTCALIFLFMVKLPIAGLVSLVGAAAFVGLPFILRVAPPIVAGNFLILAMFCFMGSMCFVVGGWSAPLLLWYSVLPALAAMVANSRWSIVWSMAAVAHLIATYLVYTMGYIEVKMSASESEILGCVSIIGFMFVLVTLTNLYERFEIQSIRRLRRTNKALKGARDRALQASKAKTSFLANMSHEFRTPLNAILGYSELILDEQELNDQIRQDLRHIKNAGTHLLELVNGLLDLNKIEAGAMIMDPKKFVLGPLIDELEATVQTQLKKNQNTLSITGDPANFRQIGMETDMLKLKQCLINLLSNATKFTHQGKVGLHITHKADSRMPFVVFAVSDTGIGMTEEQRQKVFAPFVQADASTARKYGGTGLGLAIVEKFVQSLGGRIAIDSTVGQGSTFTVSIPQKLPGA